MNSIGRWVLRVSTVIACLAVLGTVGLVLAFSVLSRDLPEIRSLADYHPKQATVLLGSSGQVVARFAAERRTVVPIERIPKVLINAVVAAEDGDFFKHQGLDYLGIIRCALKSASQGRTVCGGSTITQQTVKTFFLTPERSLTRKLKEAILTKRVEESLTKDEILYLYLNQIYFGHGAYGVQEAARVYFDKNVEDITMTDAALLAGLPQSPSRLDPYRHPDLATRRRGYVLGQMAKLSFITREERDRAFSEPIRVNPNGEVDIDNNNHFASHVRTLLQAQLGEERIGEGGYRVYTGLAPELQHAAEDAIKEGLRELDKRQGWRGPIFHFEADELKTLHPLLMSRLSTVAPSIAEIDTKDPQPVIWDMSELAIEKKDDWLDKNQLVSRTRFRRFRVDAIVGGLVSKVDDPGDSATVDLGGVAVRIPMRGGLSWARKFDNEHSTRAPKKPSDVLAVGDLVLVRATEASDKGGALKAIGVLEQVPKAQAALVAMNPSSREVVALVGGYGSGAGTFNRATQAKRQAGSTFKPFLYTSVFETGTYTTVSKCLDAPRVYRDPWTGKAWKPKNYSEGFDGEITLRQALTNSKNLCSVDLIDKIGVDRVIDTARRVGIESPMPRNLTLALGSGDVTLLEMVNGYATIASGGKRAQPIFATKVLDPTGKAVFEADRAVEQTLAPTVAYQITSLMASVVESGTAQAVKSLERPVAGKTGTSNEARNAWFIGFTPDLVVGVWVGFDDNAPLGPSETGGRAAIPIWLKFMQVATQGVPVSDFVAPAGIVFATVDPASGKLAEPGAAGVAYEPFIQGTEPTEMATENKAPTQFGIDDFEP